MVKIGRTNTDFIFEVVGWHKFWTFTNEIVVPVHHILAAYPNEQRLDAISGLRLFGTGLPGVISAGTYWVQDNVIFCDVVNYENSIAVELRDEYYKMLIIEVEDPIAAIKFLMRHRYHNYENLTP